MNIVCHLFMSYVTVSLIYDLLKHIFRILLNMFNQSNVNITCKAPDVINNSLFNCFIALAFKPAKGLVNDELHEIQSV